MSPRQLRRAALEKLAKERHRLYRLMQKAFVAIDELNHAHGLGLVKTTEYRRKRKVLTQVFEQARDRYDETSDALVGKKKR